MTLLALRRGSEGLRLPDVSRKLDKHCRNRKRCRAFLQDDPPSRDVCSRLVCRGDYPPLVGRVYRHRADGLGAEKTLSRKCPTRKLLGGECERSGWHCFFRSQSCFSTRLCEQGPPNLLSFLKPVAVSATARSTRRVRWEMSAQTGSPIMALYSLARNARSPVHAEPKHLVGVYSVEGLWTTASRDRCSSSLCKSFVTRLTSLVPRCNIGLIAFS